MTAVISEVRLEHYEKSLEPPLMTAHGSIGKRPGCWVNVRLDSGESGWGDAAPLPGFGLSADDVFPALEDAACRLSGQPCPHIDQISSVLDDLALSPIARSAIELALLDVLAQQLGLPLGHSLSGKTVQSVRSHVFVRNPTEAAYAAAAGAEAIKYKVGTRPLGDDLRAVHAIHAAAPACVLRLDVNGAWSLDEAIRAAENLNHLGPICFEQPLSMDDLDGVCDLKRRCDIFIALDESVIRHGAAVADLAFADALVLKPMFLGGILTSLSIARAAQESGLETWVTHAMASTVEYAGALHCAAILGGGPHGFLAGNKSLPEGCIIPIDRRAGHGGRP